jgi:Respiratory-chain NADH dehydrogenase, 30 Kd subunit.
MIQPAIEYSEVKPVELLDRVSDLKEQGCRLVQICCSRTGKNLEFDYSFDQDYRLIDLKMAVEPGEEIASISAVFSCAFLYENEIEALFGIRILHKSVDFEGKLYRMAEKTPFAIKDGEGK